MECLSEIKQKPRCIFFQITHSQCFPRGGPEIRLATADVMFAPVALRFRSYGIEVQGDGGTLFALAVVVTVCSAITLWARRSELPFGPWSGQNA